MKTDSSTLWDEPLCCCADFLYKAKIWHLPRRHITICNIECTKEHSVRNYVCVSVGQDSVIDITTCYGLDGPGIESQWGRDFPRPSGVVLGLIPWTQEGVLQRNTNVYYPLAFLEKAFYFRINCTHRKNTMLFFKNGRPPASIRHVCWFCLRRNPYSLFCRI